MRYLVVPVIIILSFLSNEIKGQSIVRGFVYDCTSHNPLEGVFVVYGKSRGTITDNKGYWEIKTIPDNISITFRLIGYKSVTIQVQANTGVNTEPDILLETENQLIDQVVVSADRIEQRAAELTVSLDIIKSDFLSENHILDVQELITRVPGIEILDGQASIRGGSGFSYGVGSRVLALLDGLPLLAPDAGNIKWQFLPLENLSQIEIIKGASSVMYGSSALNGVINFRSAEATNIPQTQFFTEAGLYGRPGNKNWQWWSSPRGFTSGSFSHLQKIGKTDICLGINLLSDMGYRKYNDEKLGRLSLRLKQHNAKISGLEYGLNLTSGYSTERDFILWENGTTGALIQDTSTVALFHGSFLAVDPFITFNRKGRFRHELRARMASMNNSFPIHINNNTNAISIYSEYQLWYHLSDFMSITAGISENLNRVSSNFFGDHTGNNLAAFSQLELKPVNKLKLVAGVRVEQNSLDSENEKIVPVFRAGANWQIEEYTFLRASFGQGSRYPSIAEKFAATTLGSVRIFPNPTVQNETGWSSEVGIKQGIRFSGITGQADLSLFLSENRNLIEYIFGLYPIPPTGLFEPGFQATNIEQSRVYGSELEFSLMKAFGKLNTTLTGGYTYIYPVEFNAFTNKNSSIYLKYRRKHSGKVGISCTTGKFNLGLDLYIRSKILNIDDVFLNPASREIILPGFYNYWINHNTGYFLMDGNIGYRLSDVLSLSLAVKNITNTEYMGRPGDIQPIRSFSLRLTGRF